MGAPRPTYIGGRSGPQSHPQATTSTPPAGVISAPQVVVVRIESSSLGARITALLGVLAAVVALVATVETKSAAETKARSDRQVAEMQLEAARIQLEIERLKLPRLSPQPPPTSLKSIAGPSMHTRSPRVPYEPPPA